MQGNLHTLFLGVVTVKRLRQGEETPPYAQWERYP